jgi:hypothetical protein
MSEQFYLGDSVYAETTKYGEIKLTTWNGYDDDPRNVIYMDPDVLRKFQEWLSSLKART